jgi:hypothetical protein
MQQLVSFCDAIIFPDPERRSGSCLVIHEKGQAHGGSRPFSCTKAATEADFGPDMELFSTGCAGFGLCEDFQQTPLR